MSYMNFENTRGDALKILDNFINKEIFNYNLKRNFDYGPNNRKNVSCLSPYITHRLITEYETVNKVLKKHSYQKVEKFIQEIFWRVYWKGWLELRPKVWEDFLEDLNSIENNKNILKALNGETEINCFNNWVNELKENNYLHNHSRMWFASIWIFTLKLPWQKGAEFFMQHLFDGDAASNTLGWRWVAGLQTKGKNYTAKSWNIEKFTNNKYKNIKLNEDAKPLTDKREYKLTELNFPYNGAQSENLIFFENDLNIESLKLPNYKNVYYILLNNEQRKIKLNNKVLEFKKKIVKDQLQRLKKDIQILDISDNQNLFEKIKKFDVIYPSIGENMSFLKSLKKKKNINFNFITRDEDIFCWKFSNKGFFNFKSNIPKIISYFKLI